MDFRRLRVGDWLTGAAGVAVLACMWLDWFGLEGMAGALDGVVMTGAGASAWQAFAITDVVLGLAALFALLTFLLAAVNDSPAKPVAANVLAVALSAIAVLLVLYRVAVNEPGPNSLVSLEPGAYVGLVLTVALFAAALSALRDESSPLQEPITPTELPAPPVEASAEPVG